MKTSDPHDPTLALQSQRRARTQRLLFARAAFGTTAVLSGAAEGPKIPPFVGE
jgi:hypothetical protein